MIPQSRYDYYYQRLVKKNFPETNKYLQKDNAEQVRVILFDSDHFEFQDIIDLKKNKIVKNYTYFDQNTLEKITGEEHYFIPKENVTGHAGWVTKEFLNSIGSNQFKNINNEQFLNPNTEYNSLYNSDNSGRVSIYHLTYNKYYPKKLTDSEMKKTKTQDDRHALKEKMNFHVLRAVIKATKPHLIINASSRSYRGGKSKLTIVERQSIIEIERISKDFKVPYFTAIGNSGKDVRLAYPIGENIINVAAKKSYSTYSSAENKEATNIVTTSPLLNKKGTSFSQARLAGFWASILLSVDNDDTKMKNVHKLLISATQNVLGNNITGHFNTSRDKDNVGVDTSKKFIDRIIFNLEVLSKMADRSIRESVTANMTQENPKEYNAINTPNPNLNYNISRGLSGN